MKEEQDYITRIRQEIDLCAVIPMRNEESCIVAVVDELCTALIAIPTLKRVAILIVDDFSRDNGVELLKQWFHEQQPRNCNLAVIRLQHRHGVGNTLLKGFKLAATYQPHLTLVMDADGQHDPSCVAELVERSASVEIVYTLRGKRGDSLFFRFCHTSLYNFMKYTTKKSVSTSNFCLMKLPVLEYLANANYIDYLGAFLNAAPFSCHKLTIERRDRIAGSSKLGCFGHAHTAIVVISYHPRLVTNLHHCILIVLFVLAIITIIISTPITMTLLVLFSISAELWHMQLTKILIRRAAPRSLLLEDEIEELCSVRREV